MKRAALLLPLAALLTGATAAPQAPRELCAKPGQVATGYCTMVMFYSDSFDIPDSGRPILDNVVGRIADTEGAKVVLAGYTVGGGADAMDGSRHIAQNVADYLVQQGVDQKMITVEAYATPGGARERRRVEIWVLE